MNTLTVIENELVPVYETSTGEKVVYGSELHEVLQVKSYYRDWIKNRLNDCDAMENEDYEAAKILAPSGQEKKEYIIKLDIAKEMAMLERNDIGKQVRKYFIEIEKRYNAPKSQAEILLGQAQMLVDIERKQRESEKRLVMVEESQRAVQQAIAKPIEYDFKTWVCKCLNAIAESPKFTYMGENAFQAVRRESYERFNDKRPSMLEQRVRNAKARAREHGASETNVKKINKLSVISDNKDLRLIYETVIREMMIAYCVNVA